MHDQNSENKKALIEALYRRYVIHSLEKGMRANSAYHITMNANAIESDINQVFNGGHKFLYELLQNADDVHATTVEFKLLDNNLLMTHNGWHFKENDVKRICNFATHSSANEEDKVHQMDKTGYKGVGFKAVFGISKKVTIISNQYTFKFEKEHWDSEPHAIEGVKYPWYIIPIWLDGHELPRNITENLDRKNNVYFYLEDVKSKNNEELDLFFNFPEILIFLRHVKTIILTANGTEKYRLTKKEDENDNALLTITKATNGECESKQWYQYRHPAKVTPNVHDEIQTLPDAACPQKLKDTKEVSIVFAAQVEHESFKPSQEMPLFCYLPTAVKTNLPFLVNADFLLNKNREQLLQNGWNNFLFEQIAAGQFQFFAHIANNVFHSNLKYSVVRLLSTPECTGITDDKLLTAYKSGFIESLNSVPFILSVDEQLLTVKDCVIDETRFFERFRNQVIQEATDRSRNPALDAALICDGFSDQQASRIVSFKLIEQERLLALHEYGYTINVYNWPNLISLLPEYMKRINGERSKYLDKHDNESLDTHEQIVSLINQILYFLIQEGRDYLQQIKDANFIITQENTLQSPTQCFLQETNADETVIEFAQMYKLSQIDMSVYSHDEVLDLLKNSLAVNPLKPENIIKVLICPKIMENEINYAQSIQWLQFIYLWYLRDDNLLGNLKTAQPTLSQFPILTAREATKKHDYNLTPIYSCYFPSKNIDGQSLIIANDYFDGADHKTDNNAWESLLSWFGIQMAIKLKVLPLMTYSGVKEYFEKRFRKGTIIEEYFNEMLNGISQKVIKHYARSPSKIKKDAGLYAFKNFTVFEPLFSTPATPTLSDYQISETTLRFFLLALTKDWEKLLPCELYRNYYSQWEQTAAFAEHFLSFYFKHYVLKKEPYQLIYMPRIVEIIGEEDFKKLQLARLDRIGIEVTAEQATFLGFRTSLSADECLQLLERENKATAKSLKQKIIPNVQRLKIIYEMLIAACATGNYSKKAIKKWQREKQLLAYNNTLQPASQLKICNVSDLDHDLTSSEHWLHNCGLRTHQLQQLADILQLDLFSELQNENCTYVVSDEVNDQSISNNLYQFVIDCLPQLVLVEAKHLNQDAKELFPLVFNHFCTTIESFVCCQDICFFDGHRRHNPMLIKDKKLLFQGRWATILPTIASLLGDHLFKTDIAKAKLIQILKEIENIDNLQDEEPNYPSTLSQEKLDALIEMKNNLVAIMKNNRSPLQSDSHVKDTKRPQIKVTQDSTTGTSSSFFRKGTTAPSPQRALQQPLPDAPSSGDKNRKNSENESDKATKESASVDAGNSSTTRKEKKSTSTKVPDRLRSLDKFPHKKPNKIRRKGPYQGKGTKKTLTPADQEKIEKRSNETGKRGEERVYEFLYTEYQKNLVDKQGYKYSETPQGFKLQQETEDSLKTINIIWMNGQRNTKTNSMEYVESGKPADFKILESVTDKKTGKEQTIKKLYIEVKATEKDKAAVLNYSKNEWHRMFKYMPNKQTDAATSNGMAREDDYHLYRVYKVYDDHEWSLAIMGNPAQKIQHAIQEQNKGDNKFIVESVQFKL